MPRPFQNPEHLTISLREVGEGGDISVMTAGGAPSPELGCWGTGAGTRHPCENAADLFVLGRKPVV